jgi:hypothetical protein
MFGGYTQINGLTKGKEYVGSIVTTGYWADNIMIVVLDDDSEWFGYSPQRFEPVEN